jgi:hypothetical protein
MSTMRKIKGSRPFTNRGGEVHERRKTRRDISGWLWIHGVKTPIRR